MDLKEFVKKKYGENLKTSEYDAKYQMILKRLNAIFESFDSYIVKAGKRKKIICNQSAPKLDAYSSSETYSEELFLIDQARKLSAILVFFALNYYLPNQKSKRQSAEKNLDGLFEDFINGIYHGPEKLGYFISNLQEKIFASRVKLGKDFESYLGAMIDQDDHKRNHTINFCRDMLERKKEATNLYLSVKDGKYTDEDITQEICRIYERISTFCDTICDNPDYGNLMDIYYEYNFIDAESVKLFLQDRMDIDEVFYEKDAEEFYDMYLCFIEGYANRLNKSAVAIDDINEAEESLLNYLLDEFGKETNKEAPASIDKNVLDNMTKDNWDVFPLDHREKILFFIKGLIDEYGESEITRYERLNKYTRRNSVDGVKDRMREIELKLKFPQVYRVFRYLKKLHNIYGDIDNAEFIMSFLGEENLSATERKFKRIFEEQEELYRLCTDPREIEKRSVNRENDDLSLISEETLFHKDT